MYTRFENLWTQGGVSAGPLTDPCPIYRYFCCNSMFAFLEKKKTKMKKPPHLQNYTLKIMELLGKARLGKENSKLMEL